MDQSTLVPSTLGNVNTESDPTPIPTIHTKPSNRNGSSTASKPIIKTSSMENIGEFVTSKNLSETASNLITNFRAKGTRQHYLSAWKKFQSWCSERKVDPIRCPLEHILNYLGTLFDKKLGYNAINTHRFALSHFREPIDGFKVGKHPSICRLLKGVSRERPPVPKYTFIWDIEKVLSKMKDMPPNNELTLTDISFKTN